MPASSKVSKWIVLGLTVLGWILAIVSITNCRFIESGGYYYVGLFKGGSQNFSCESYEGGDFDTSHTAARACGILATLFTGLGWVLLLAAILLFPKKILWTIFRVMISLSVLFQVGTFAIFELCNVDGGGDCSVGPASIIGAINVFLLLATAILSCSTPTPEEAVFKNACACNKKEDKGDAYTGAVAGQHATQSATNTKVNEIPLDENVEVPYATAMSAASSGRRIVKTSIKTDRDGTKTTTKEVTEADGSKTITTTVEQVF